LRVLVTGSSGFVGSAILARLLEMEKYQLRTVGRSKSKNPSGDLDHVVIQDLSTDTKLANAVKDVDVIIHAAARVHVLQESSTDPLADYRTVNVKGSMNLAQLGVEAGVRRLIFISSIKVNGESTEAGKPYTAEDVPAPIDPYGVSKYEAELGLMQIAEKSGLEVVIIRPVIVYGAGVKANFLSMMNWLNKGIPLPFGSVDNKRSFVALDNLVDLVVTCIDHPGASNQTFLVSDGEDLSTTELLGRMARALGKPSRLLPVPIGLLQTGARLLGKSDIAQRILGSLQVDISKTKKVLGWMPPVGVDEAMRSTVKDFNDRHLR
jgi:nucleoside-diphosphate-sugar epimerase